MIGNHTMNDIFEEIKTAFHNDDVHRVRELLARHPEFKARINEPVVDFDAPVIISVRSREMLDVLLNAGADLNAKSRWWAGGFGLLHCASPELAAYAIERGAVVDVHAASRLGLIDKLAELIAADPALVYARGGDGQTPLHFASTIAIAEYLLDHGAAIDARDVDHESTPAQYMLRERPHVARYLITRGCMTDILMTSALGEFELVRRHLDADPEAVRVRVNEEYFPKRDRRSGGTIYQWTLGWHVSPHQAAKEFGHEQVFALLMERSPHEVKLLAACWLGEEARLNHVLVEESNFISNMREADLRQLAHAARNNNLSAVRLMLQIGLPIDACGQHEATPLHWAAFHGNAEMAELLLRHNPPLETLDKDFNATPLGWAMHGSEHGWHREAGNYGAVVEKLLRAGARPPEVAAGSAEVKQALQRFGLNKGSSSN